tara:strand:+ start:886 stop:1335 length:450 start_codon:yes stop_codon:yes gene_type:complete
MASRGDHYASLLKQALEILGYVQITQTLSAERGRVRLLLRVHNEQLWLNFIEVLLRAGITGSLHICKVFFLKGSSPKSSQMVYGWHLGLNSPDMESSIETIVGILQSRNSGKPESAQSSIVAGTMDIPLVGAGKTRGMFNKGKGARVAK